MWFRVLPAGDRAVGGQVKVNDTYVRGRTTCFARIIAPEGFLDTGLKLRAIAEITAHLRDALVTDPPDDGTGIRVHVVEMPEGQWGAAGSPGPLLDRIEGTNGTVSAERVAEFQTRFAGIDRLKPRFGIPG